MLHPNPPPVGGGGLVQSAMLGLKGKGIDALQRGGLKIKKFVLRRLQTAPKGTFINSDE